LEKMHYDHFFPHLKKDYLGKNTFYDEKKEVKKLILSFLGKGLWIKGETVEERVEESKKAVLKKRKAIFNPVFVFDDILIEIDALIWSEKGYDIYDIKSASSLKTIFFDALALQLFVLNRLDIPTEKVILCTIHQNYTFHQKLEPEKLIEKREVRESVLERIPKITEKIETAKKALENKTMSFEKEIGKRCYFPECGYLEDCWKKKQVPYPSIFNLSRMDKVSKFELYSQGIKNLKDIPEEIVQKLEKKQKIQIEADRTGKPFIDSEKIKEFLDTITYPLYFLDFETVQHPVPRFEGVKPNKHIPFQFSLHYLESETSKLKHFEFLADEKKDPRSFVAEKIVEWINPNHCILSYNSGFEKAVIRKLAEFCPQKSETLLQIAQNIKDLMQPFKNFSYYQKEMNGRYSIKSVLSALIPEESYSKLNIKNGGEATFVYKSLEYIQDEKIKMEKKKDLLDYCRLDTYAMVLILNYLKKI